MHVRPATADDLESIRAVARETWHDTYDELDAETIDWAIDEWYGAGAIPLEAPGTVVLVVEVEDAAGEGSSDRADDTPVNEWDARSTAAAEPAGEEPAAESGNDAGDRIVGFAQAVVHGETADVLRLYVHPDFQGRGIGTRLHERLRIQLEAYDIERIQLIDFAFNDEGRGFYESLGFERTDEGEVEIAGEFYPEVVYTLEV
ncbi:GNAT family N-acetyltransferase [Halostagnicola kamekurae]|uniref:Acetyltransferase (GNAT) family protein n=1 Tax=Halostagnicola kamekurae TaxID=619731 RepID=A0A1I6NXN0_9EURY|nr:GNAT family N-acetyltransferase [Halostagnicola kamekurae]SFS32691.1 Acetyltransferase (GNAT) family protein [Halostagnicola kamekurae]